MLSSDTPCMLQSDEHGDERTAYALKALDSLHSNVLLTAASACVQGNVIVVGRKSPFSLYDEKIASFEDDGGLYDQKDAAGFIKLQVWPIRQELGCTLLSHKMKLFQASGAVLSNRKVFRCWFSDARAFMVALY